MRKIVAKKDHPLLDYIERARRKRLNKVKKEKLMALLGKDVPTPTAAEVKNEDTDDEMDSGYDEDKEERY